MPSPDKSRRPTSADVAREAGLSRSTVSYVLNDDPHQKIPAGTRERVYAAARKLGYTPSAAARALRSGRSDLVLCLLPDWPIGPSLGSLLEHLSAGLESHGLTLILHPRAHSTRPITDLWKSITPAAVLLLEELNEQDTEAIQAAGAAVTMVLLSDVKSRRAKFSFSEESLGRLQVERLAVKGHRRLGYAYPDDSRVEAFAVARLAGVRMACADLELPEPVVYPVPLEPLAAEAAVGAWRKLRPRITAVCAYNDEVAIAVLRGAQRLELRLPRDLAVIGIDDIPTAPLTSPPLTTIRRNFETYAEVIASTVLRSIEGGPVQVRWPHSESMILVERESA